MLRPNTISAKFICYSMVAKGIKQPLLHGNLHGFHQDLNEGPRPGGLPTNTFVSCRTVAEELIKLTLQLPI